MCKTSVSIHSFQSKHKCFRLKCLCVCVHVCAYRYRLMVGWMNGYGYTTNCLHLNFCVLLLLLLLMMMVVVLLRKKNWCDLRDGLRNNVMTELHENRSFPRWYFNRRINLRCVCARKCLWCTFMLLTSWVLLIYEISIWA